MNTMKMKLTIAVFAMAAGSLHAETANALTLSCNTTTYTSKEQIKKSYTYIVDEFGNVDAGSGIEPLGALRIRFQELVNSGTLPAGTGRLLIYMPLNNGDVSLYSYSTLIPGDMGIHANLENLKVPLVNGAIADLFQIHCSLTQ